MKSEGPEMGENLDTQNSKNGLGTSDLAAGGGAGGVLVYAINTYVPDTKLQTLLIYLVPTASIVFMAIFSFIARLAGEAWKNYDAERTRKSLLKRAKAALADAKEQLVAIEADRMATIEHKFEARERVQKIERALIDLNVRGIVSVD
jgi:hypothetical protein